MRVGFFLLAKLHFSACLNVKEMKTKEMQNSDFNAEKLRFAN